MRVLNNPYAPSSYLGLRDVAPEYDIEPFDYIYDAVLTASLAFTDQKSIDTDADFIWEATTISLYTSVLFTVRFSDSRQYFLSDFPIAAAVYVNADPYPTMPPIIIPAGGRIGINGVETSGSTNTIQIAFRGAKRTRVR